MYNSNFNFLLFIRSSTTIILGHVIVSNFIYVGWQRQKKNFLPVEWHVRRCKFSNVQAYTLHIFSFHLSGTQGANSLIHKHILFPWHHPWTYPSSMTSSVSLSFICEFILLLVGASSSSSHFCCRFILCSNQQCPSPSPRSLAMSHTWWNDASVNDERTQKWQNKVIG